MSLTLKSSRRRQHVRLCAARSAGQPPSVPVRQWRMGSLPRWSYFACASLPCGEGSTQPGSVAICVATPVTENLAGEAAKARWLWLRGQGAPPRTRGLGTVRKWRLRWRAGELRAMRSPVLLGVETVGGLSIGGDGRGPWGPVHVPGTKLGISDAH